MKTVNLICFVSIVGLGTGLVACSEGSSRRPGKSCSATDQELSLNARSKDANTISSENDLPDGHYRMREAHLLYQAPATAANSQNVKIYALESKDKNGAFQTSFNCARGVRVDQDITAAVKGAAEIVKSGATKTVTAKTFGFTKQGYEWSASFSKSSAETFSSLQDTYGAGIPITIYREGTSEVFEVHAEVKSDGNTIYVVVIFDRSDS